MQGPNNVTVRPVAGQHKARMTTVAIGLPDVQWVRESEMDERWHLADFTPASPAYPAGMVRLNEDHFMVVEQVRFHQDRMIRQDEVALDGVKHIVKTAYGDAAAAKVAHPEALKRIPNGPTPQDVDTTLRSPAALTAALMGLVDADAMIGPQLGKVGKTRK